MLSNFALLLVVFKRHRGCERVNIEVAGWLTRAKTFAAVAGPFFCFCSCSCDQVGPTTSAQAPTGQQKLVFLSSVVALSSSIVGWSRRLAAINNDRRPGHHPIRSSLSGTLSPDSARIGSATQGTFLVSSHLSSDTVSALGKVWVRTKLQALVYDILPSTTAIFSYAIGSRKLSANKHFFVGAQTVVSLLQATQIKQGVPFIAANKVYTSANKTTIV